MPAVASVFARSLRTERVHRGWDHKELGRRIGWTRTTFSGLETGRRKLDVDDMAPLCRVLCLSLAELAIGADAAELQALRL